MVIQEFQDLNKSNFVTITMDISNKKDIKIIAFIVRYFIPEEDVKIKLLDFKSVPF